MPQYTTAHSPKWIDDNSISLVVKFNHLDSEIPFIASISDTDPYNQDLFNTAKTGGFGLVAPIGAVLTELQTQRWNEVTTIRDTLIQKGGCKVNAKWFHSDTHSKLQQLGLLISGTNLPADLKWKTMDGTFVDMTPTLTQQLYQAQMMTESAIFSYAEQLRSLIMSSVNPMSIDIVNGWPETWKN